MGIKTITLYDDKCATLWDLGSQFFLTIDDIGKNRAEVSLPKLQQLNEFCDLSIHRGQIEDEHFLAQFSVVIFTDTFAGNLVYVNHLCRNKGVKFISAVSRGVFGQVFVDLGDKFTVIDKDGEQPTSGIVVSITVDRETGIAIVDTKDEDNLNPHGLFDGDLVIFRGVCGMTELNDGKPRIIKRVDAYKFSVANARQYGTYKNGGYWTQIKQPQELNFRSLEACIADPQIEFIYDFSKMEHPIQLHTAFTSLTQFEQQFGRLPESYSSDDAEKLHKMAIEINEKAKYVENVDPNIIKLLSYTCRGEINPMSTLLGGLVAQEAQKAVTSKFNPIKQWFYYESTLSLPNPLPMPEDAQPQHTRYDAYIAVFGNSFHRRIQNQRIFLVGAGALGCEFLKNFAVMGIATGAKGKVIVTDMDHIEISNLSRQFLFRQEHVNSSKSEVAASAAKAMNIEMDIEALTDRVGPETENTFNDKFWKNLDIITNALDNIDARLYVDKQCIQYLKPLLESGTLGTKGNTQVVIPNMTESYGSQKDPEQKQFPECTIHHFPNVIEHTISWAKLFFSTTFNTSVQEVNLYRKNPQAYLDDRGNNLTSLSTLYDYLVTYPQSFEDCVRWARTRFQELYNYSIRDIIATYPEDAITKSGAPFWSGTKRFPQPLQFDASDETHLSFIESAARLWAQLFGINVPNNFDAYSDICDATIIPDYVPNPIEDAEKKRENGETEQQEPKKEINEEEIKRREDRIKTLKSEIVKSNPVFKLREIEFEKDDDTNYHIAFLTAASNLRARCYKIPEIDRHETKGIAGNIIPAMITTTALITGLVMFEMYKIVDKKPIEEYRNSFVNIGIPFITMAEPRSAKLEIANKYTVWDRIDIDMGRDITLKELMNVVKERTGFRVVSITFKKSLIYMCIGFKDREQAENTPVAEWIENFDILPKKSDTIKLQVLTADLNNRTSDPFNLPPVIYKFRNFVNKKEQLAFKKKLALEKKRRKLNNDEDH
jgi:ubiquitin-activating enzyme E1